MVIKLRRAAEPRESCFWALREARAASLPSACSCPFLTRASSAPSGCTASASFSRQRTEPLSSAPVVKYPRKRPHGARSQMAVRPPQSRPAVVREWATWLRSKREEECSPGKVAPFTESKGAGLKEFQLPLTHTTASSSDLFIFFF